MDSPVAPSIHIEPPEEDNQQLTNEPDFSIPAYSPQSITNYFDGNGFAVEDDLFNVGDFPYNCDYSIGPPTDAMFIFF